MPGDTPQEAQRARGGKTTSRMHQHFPSGRRPSRSVGVRKVDDCDSSDFTFLDRTHSSRLLGVGTAIQRLIHYRRYTIGRSSPPMYSTTPPSIQRHKQPPIYSISLPAEYNSCQSNASVPHIMGQVRYPYAKSTQHHTSLLPSLVYR